MCVKAHKKEEVMKQVWNRSSYKNLKQILKNFSVHSDCETFLPFILIIEHSDPTVKLSYLFNIPFTPEVQITLLSIILCQAKSWFSYLMQTLYTMQSPKMQ